MFFPSRVRTNILPKRVTFVITTLADGGAENQVYQLATSLKQRGWDIAIVTLIDSTLYEERFRILNIPIISLHMKPGIPNPKSIVSLANIIRRLNPTILHSHQVHANILSRVSRLIYSPPVLISTAHSLFEGGKPYDILYKFTDQLCDMTTHVCRVGADRLINVGATKKDKIINIPNGINCGITDNDSAPKLTELANAKSEHDFVWLAAGRFTTAKNYPNLLKAFSILTKSTPTQLLIAGIGPLQSECQELAEKLRINKYVTFLGYRGDLPNLMNFADAYVLSSSWEGFPIVLLEASLFRLPIVSTNVGGCNEIVHEGENGFLVPTNEPQMLAEAMKRLMDLPKPIRTQMGRNGEAFVRQHFNLDAITDHWESLYISLLTKKRMKLQ